MATIGKINIGVNSRKNFHDFKHDVNSTLSFGFCEPTLIHSMHAKSSIALKSSSVVRLAPLPCPTFGRMKARTDTVFVPMTDVFEAWNEFISGTAYNTANGSGVPDTVDFMTFNNFLLLMLQCGAYLDNAGYGGYNPTTFRLEHMDNILRQMFTFSFSVNWDIFADGDTLEDDAYTPTDWKDLDTLIMAAATPKGKQRAIRFLSLFIDNCCSYGSSFTSADTLASKLGMTESNTNNSKLFSYQGDAEGDAIFNSTPLHYFFRPSYFKNCDLSDDTDFLSGIPSLVSAFAGAPDVVNSVFDNPRTHANYDFTFVYEPAYIQHWAAKSAFDDNSDDENVNSIENNGKFRVALNMHLTPYGKRVMKILNTMGVTQRYNDALELPKLFAYYKAWFDLFDPQRTKNWKQTNVYRLVHDYYDYRCVANDILTFGATFESDGDYADFTVLFNNVLIDLVKCNYYLGADTITVANRYPLQPANGNINNPAMLQGLNPVLYQGKDDDGLISSQVFAGDGSGYAVQNSQSALTALSVVALERLYYAINKESALAANIEDIMLARFGVNIKSTRILGRSDYNIEIDPIFATVNNDQTQLGEYGGKSVANGTTKDIDFTAPVQGYVVQMFSIVPYGGYVQASTPAQIKRGQFYSDFTAMFDSMGYEKLYKSQVLGRESVINNFKNDEVFGEVPQMFHLKYRNNLANGGFAFHSERASFLPYSLDRLFSEGELQNTSFDLGGYQPDPYSKPIDVVPDTIMRTVGLYEGFGNYDRIFYDTTGLSDNFILHMIQDLKYYSPMKSISNSFDTVDKNVDDDTRQVERA